LAVTKFDIEIDNEKIFNRRAKELMMNNLEGFSVVGVKNEKAEEVIKLEEEFRERDEILVRSMVSTLPVREEVMPKSLDLDRNSFVLEENKNMEQEIPNSDNNGLNTDSEVPASQIEQAYRNLEIVSPSENVIEQNIDLTEVEKPLEEYNDQDEIKEKENPEESHNKEENMIQEQNTNQLINQEDNPELIENPNIEVQIPNQEEHNINHDPTTLELTPNENPTLDENNTNHIDN
jgi:hypothetical protein